MRRAEHADFEQAILRVADYFRARGLRASIIEKDYYVTEALSILDRPSRGGLFFIERHPIFQATSIDKSAHVNRSQKLLDDGLLGT